MTGGDPPRIALGRAALDRAAHRRGDAAWLAAAWRRGRVVVVDTASGAALVDGADRLVLRGPADVPHVAPPPDADPAAHGAYFLGVDDAGAPYFGVAADLCPGPGERAAGLRDVAHRLAPRDADLVAAALGVAHWHARHRHGAGSGAPTAAREGGWSQVDADGAAAWPRTDPAVIMLVTDAAAGPRGRALLAVGASWSRPDVQRFSCLAGFVEPGESAESTVAREVREEVGLTVGAVRYVGSQPWPYPSSLMLGFLADGDPAAPLVLEPGEIAEARWFTRAEVAAVRAGAVLRTAAGVRVGVTDNASISAYLIDRWLAAG